MTIYILSIFNFYSSHPIFGFEAVLDFYIHSVANTCDYLSACIGLLYAIGEQIYKYTVAREFE